MTKAVPVILKELQDELWLLAFVHPLAGKQLVKGTVEPGETIDQACVRELYEESGLTGTVREAMGAFPDESGTQEWHFFLMNVLEEIPDTFVHHTTDGGGLEFAFFWYRLDEEPDEQWHEGFYRPLAFIRTHCNR